MHQVKAQPQLHQILLSADQTSLSEDPEAASTKVLRILEFPFLLNMPDPGSLCQLSDICS